MTNNPNLKTNCSNLDQLKYTPWILSVSSPSAQEISNLLSGKILEIIPASRTSKLVTVLDVAAKPSMFSEDPGKTFKKSTHSPNSIDSLISLCVVAQWLWLLSALVIHSRLVTLPTSNSLPLKNRCGEGLFSGAFGASFREGRIRNKGGPAEVLLSKIISRRKVVGF